MISKRSSGTSTGAEAGDDVRLGVAQRSIGRHDDYVHATRTVARLRQAGLPAGQVAVVGGALRPVDRDRGRLSTADVAGRGAVSGLLVGGAVGGLLWVFGLTSDTLSTGWLVINTAALGAVLGAAVALLGYVITQGRRSFAADGAVRAGYYDVVVDADFADRAVRLLRAEDGNRGQPSPPVEPAPPAT